MAKFLKCQFHSHAFGDPVDHIAFSPKTLITRAVKLGYDVLSITCHRKILFTKELKQFAAKKGILLIPGIEFEINRKHILAINPTKEILEVKTFDDLKRYRKNNPQSLIIAPHPFFLSHFCLGKDLEKNIDLFDAIEISWFYTKKLDLNKKAIKIAEQYNKPLISTADCHILDFLDIGYTKVQAEKNTKSLFQAIKKGNLKNYTQATSIFKMSRSIIQVGLQTTLKKCRSWI